jgi:uncharacterized protein YggE
MIRTKAALATAACLAGVISGSIAAAQADTSSTAATTPPTPASITVNGSGTITVDSSASTASVQASYLTALGSAMTDAQTKATALTTQVGDTLGTIENITEQSGDGDLCSGPLFAAAGTAKGAPVPAVSPGSSKKKSHGSKPKAAALEIPARATNAMAIVRTADISPTSCTIEADVTVTYAMAPAS